MKKIMEKRDLEKNMKRQKREKPYRDRKEKNPIEIEEEIKKRKVKK